MMKIILFGAQRCHKTQFYQAYFKDKKLDIEFFDVEKEEAAATRLRSLYTSGKLNFPTVLIGEKRLRNPSIKDLEKWLIKKP